MLRIYVHADMPVTSFVLEGKLIGPWVTELEKCWATALSLNSSRKMIVDLADVTFVDSEGRALLARMHLNGVRFLSAGVLLNAIVAEIESEERSTTSERSWRGDVKNSARRDATQR